MSKHHAAEEKPAATQMSWIQGLAKPLEAESASKLPFYGALVGHPPRHGDDVDSDTDAEHRPAALVPNSTATGPIRRISAVEVDTVIGRLDEPESPAGKSTGQRGRSRPIRARLRKPVLIGAAATLALLTVGGGTVSAMDKTVSIVVDGKTEKVTTLASSVAGALAAAGISPNSHDTLAPDVNATISDGSTIILDRGRLLTVTVDGQQRQVWTTARTVDEALAQMGTSTSDLALSANRSRSIPVEGLSLSAFTLHRVSVSVAGGSATSSMTAARTVGELLAAQKVTVGARDIVKPARTTPLSDGLVITVDRIAVTSTSTTVPLSQPPAISVNDAALAKGTSKVVQQGKPGTALITYTVRNVNGRQVGKTETGRRTVLAPVGQITHVGTKTSFTYVGEEVFTNDTSFGVNWDGLANCESTHNPKAVNANPSAGLPTYGLFQFDEPTWASVGGSGNPMDATPEEQLMRAKLLFQQRGLDPWACAYAAH